MLRSQRASPPALNLFQPDKLFFLMRSAPESDAFRLSDFCLHLLQIKPLPCRCAPAFGRAVENLAFLPGFSLREVWPCTPTAENRGCWGPRAEAQTYLVGRKLTSGPCRAIFSRAWRR